MAKSVRIFEVGPRDGLQNDARTLSVQARIQWVSALVDAGYKDIEVAAFVRPERVPQMANSVEVLKGLLKKYSNKTSEKNAPTFWSLVPNQKGLENAVAAGAKAIGLFTAATDGFTNKNIGMSVAESLTEYALVAKQARKEKMKIRGYISTAFGCPFDGRVETKKVLSVAEALLKMGCNEISIGDTIGVANPVQVEKISAALVQKFGARKIAMHFHDTRGTALANVWAAYNEGITVFDSSAGGLGGCPFAPGAKGNLATEDALYMFKESGVNTGIDYQKMCLSSLAMQQHLGPPALTSRALQAFGSSSMWDRK